MVDDVTLATVRFIHYPVQFERDPTSPEAIAWVAEVIEGDEAAPSRAELLDHIHEALAVEGDLAAKVGIEGHTDAQVRAFLRAVAARLDPAGSARG